MPAARAVTAVLGPTNTGKTHLAVERMLAHGGGMIGLPLRLLAREIYDRVRLRTGDHAVALVTGEEKIVPASPRYWVATVEAMPPDVDVPFLAIDEIQLAADLERGHIFTDRILNRRGREETMLLGAATMRQPIEELLPGTTFIARPRFSKLTYSGQKKITRLPKRSAAVCFSAQTVYATAELIRRQRGGAAVVLGALSPRTRNAQVALYQSGDVDYLVATDAIGMGLNMDVDHVAFASTRKFDGFHYRHLTPAELGQIAGRAGRYMSDGTFGTTGEAEPFDADTVEALENHRFESVRVIQWRNRDLDFRSIESLRRGLNAFPKLNGLTRAQPAPDVLALEALCRDDDTVALVTSPRLVETLWEVCQIPDYRNISPSEHASLVGRIFGFLASGTGRIPEDWIARQLAHCDRSEGDIDTLSNRIAHVRTWTFVANRADWLEAPLFWQQRAREIEDRLSDALHERLIQRFIDRRTSVLMKRLAQKGDLMTTVEDDGAFHVEGECVGHIRGFRFVPDGEAQAKTIKAASLKAVAQEIATRAKTVAASTDPDLTLTRTGEVIWQKQPVARLVPDHAILKPRVDVLADDLLESAERAEVQGRIEKWLQRHTAAQIEPLVKLSEAEDLKGLAGGIAFRLIETLGILPRETVAADVKSLGQEDRAKLRQYGVRFGAFSIFMPALLKPAATQLRVLLWGLASQKDGKLEIAALPQSPANGLTSTPCETALPDGFYGVCGYRTCGTRAVRIDMLERLADLVRDRVFWRPRIPEEKRPAGSVEGGGFSVVPEMMSLVGCSGEQFQDILRSLGFRMQHRKVRRPAAVPSAPAQDATGVAVEPSAASSEPPTSGVVGEAPEETVAPGSETPAAEVSTAEPAPPEQSAQETAAPVPAETVAEEEIEIEVWWPKDTGPFRHREHKPPPRNKHHGKRPPRPNKPVAVLEAPAAAPRIPKERKREKPVDPDSPFAVLGALKAKLVGERP